MSWTSSRRALLLGALSLPLLLRSTVASANASADPVTSRVARVSRDERGTTLYLELEYAPFPAAGGSPYKDPTVIVFVPSHFRVPRTDRVDMIVHFHGHSTTAEAAMKAHQLREQLHDSKQNAILIMPQGPTNASDSYAGKLEMPQGFARMIADVKATLQSNVARAALGVTGITPGAVLGSLCVSAHSGGYHAAAACLRLGGLEINEVYLFDALYNEWDTFRDWVIAGKGRTERTRHKVVSYYTPGGTTAGLSNQLMKELEKAGMRCAHEQVEGALSRSEITRADAVFIRSGLSHGGVTHELNALRDCLFASALTRHLRSSWFEERGQHRRLERR